MTREQAEQVIEMAVELWTVGAAGEPFAVDWSQHRPLVRAALNTVGPGGLRPNRIGVLDKILNEDQ